MGHIILVFFQGGVLVSYAMPKADPYNILNFLKIKWELISEDCKYSFQD
ncbi:MAG: hypothetical protein ACFE8E_14665 [Candidatus Hodarchaeota archaeon]